MLDLVIVFFIIYFIWNNLLLFFNFILSLFHLSVSIFIYLINLKKLRY